MSYFMSCQKCGKVMTVNHESDEPICAVCFFGFENVDESLIEKLIEKATDKLSIEKLQEQLNTAKKALTEIAEILNDKIHKCDYSCDNFCEFDGSLNMYSVENVQSVIDSLLAAIGGDG